MTTVTFLFLTLFTWMVSSGTWRSLDQCTELSQYGHDEETEAFSSSVSCKNVVIHDKTKLTLTCERSPETSAALERIFTQDRITEDCTLFPAVPMNMVFFNHCVVNPFERLKETMNREKQNRCVRKCKIQHFLLYFQLKTIEIQTDNDSTHLNYGSICPPSVLLRSAAQCSHIVTLVLVDHLKAMDCICICTAHNLKIKIQQGFLCRELRPAFPEFSILMNQVSLTSPEESNRAYVRIGSVQMLSVFYATQCPKEAFITQAVYTGRVETVHPDTSRWFGGFFLAGVLLLGTYMRRRIKISPSSVSPAHDSNCTTVMFFTLTLHCFSPSVTTHQPSEWSRIAVGISFAVYLSCALGRTVHVLLACRATHTVTKLFCTTQFRALPFMMLFLWLTFSPPFPNKIIKHWFEDILVEGSVGSTLRSWAVLGQMELLATLYCGLVSLPSLLHSILTKQNFLSVLIHVQLVTCLQNSRVPTKYVLVIKINRFI